MSTIWKYELPIGDQFTIDIPNAGRIVHAEVIDNKPFIWVLVDESEGLLRWHFTGYGTGYKMPADPGNHVKTFVMSEGKFVYHVFYIRTSAVPENAAQTGPVSGTSAG